MGTQRDAVKAARHPLSIAVLVAALAVAGCFTAAFTFAEQPVQARAVEKGR